MGVMLLGGFCQMRVEERDSVCMRVFSTLMTWSNENRSCMRVDES